MNTFKETTWVSTKQITQLTTHNIATLALCVSWITGVACRVACCMQGCVFPQILISPSYRFLKFFPQVLVSSSSRFLKFSFPQVFVSSIPCTQIYPYKDLYLPSHHDITTALMFYTSYSDMCFPWYFVSPLVSLAQIHNVAKATQ